MTISSKPRGPTSDPVEAVHQALRNLNRPARLSESAWATSCLAAEKLHDQDELARALALKSVLTENLARLEHEGPIYGDLLRGRFWEGLTVAEMVGKQRPQAQSDRRFFEQQHRALVRFAALLREAEEACQQNRAGHRLLRRLPLPTCQRLFGVERYAAKLTHCLHHRERYPIISIKGIGGIGKTTLADYAVRRYLTRDESLHDLCWISAKQQYLTPSGIIGARSRIQIDQIFDELGYKLGLSEVLRLPLPQKIDKLSSVLRTAPHLVVLDNLESVEDFEQLAPWLAKLADPTQFVLTARQTIPALANVTEIDLRELDHDASIELIHFTAREKGVRDLRPEALYRLVGGNPLAIILLVSQMNQLPEAKVLEGMQLGTAPEIYSYIYWQSWKVLAEVEQEILFDIQRAGDQADWTWLATTTGFPSSALNRALQRLLDLALIQPQQGADGTYVYAIHRLTSTFLRAEVLGWQ